MGIVFMKMNSRMLGPFAFVLFFSFLWAGASALAESIDSCEVISESGAYTLSQDISSVTGDCIVVTADNVTIEGNGHVIDGTDTGSVGQHRSRLRRVRDPHRGTVGQRGPRPR